MIATNFRNIIKKSKYPLILLVFTLIFFWKMIFFPSYVPYSPFSDLITQDLFWKYLLYDTFQRFQELPFWNPYTFSGAPFLANHIPKILYPTNMIFLFTSHTGLLFNYIYLLHFFFAGTFLYLFARSIGIDKFSSFIASIIYVFNIRFVTLIYAGITNELPLLVFLPATLYLFELLIKKNKLFYSILMSLSLSLIILGVHTQYIIYSYIFLFFYFLFRIFIIYKNNKDLSIIKRISSLFILSILVSILLSSIQLLPSLEILKYDTRSRGLDYEHATVSSSPPYHIITAIIPNFFGTLLHNNYWGLFPFWQFTIYVGILPLILSLFAFRRKNYFVIFFIIVLLLSLFLALGKYNPIYYLLYKLLPLFGKFRAPSRFLFFYIFSISIIGGFGAEHLANIKTRSDKVYLKKVLVMLTSILILSTLVFFSILIFKEDMLNFGDKILESKYYKSNLELRPISYYKEKTQSVFGEIADGMGIFIIILLSTIIMLQLWLKNKLNSDIFKIITIFVLLADLWLFSMPLIDVKSLNFVYTQNDIPSFLSKDKGYFRVLDLANALPQETAIRYNIQQIGGYDPMILADYRQFVSEMVGIPFIPSTVIPIKEIKYPKMLNLLNVKYIISSKRLKDSGYELVYNNTVFVYTNNEKKFYSDKRLNDSLFEFSNLQTDYVYRNKEAMPRAFVVGNYVSAERDKILDILKSDEFDLKKYIMLEQDINKRAQGNKFKEAEITFYSPNKIAVKVNADQPGFLVLSEIWYPGWKAFDNGNETKIYRADYMFRSVHLDRGTHKIEFIFEPLSFKIGKLVSSITLIFIMVFFVKFINNSNL